MIAVSNLKTSAIEFRDCNFLLIFYIIKKIKIIYALLSNLGNMLLEIFLPRKSKKHGVGRESSVHIMHALNI